MKLYPWNILKPNQKCKPCITIRNVITIVKNNVIECYKNIRRDIRSYSMVNATVCSLDNGTPVLPLFLRDKTVEDIRKKAIENHIPTTEEFYEDLRKDLKFQFKEEDRKKIEDAFERELDKLQSFSREMDYIKPEQK